MKSAHNTWSLLCILTGRSTQPISYSPVRRYTLVDPHWSGAPLFIVFFVPLAYPMTLPQDCVINSIRSNEPVPWLRFTGGCNFVGMRVWRMTELHVYDIEKTAN